MRGVLLHICDCIHSLTMLSRFSAYLISQELLQAGEVLTVSCMLSLCVYLVLQKHIYIVIFVVEKFHELVCENHT